MVNPFHDINWRPDLAARRRFGLSLVVGFLVLASALAVAVRLRSGTWAEWPLVMGAVGVGLGGFCWCLPRFARPLYVIWYALGASIGIVVSNVLLVLTYYLTLVPIGLLLRLCGRDPMRRKLEPERGSYWETAKVDRTPASYLRQF